LTTIANNPRTSYYYLRYCLRKGEIVMPTYEYACANCGEQFMRTMSLKEFEAGKVTCPKCNSGEVKLQMSVFTSQTSRKS
jgi:putative FmdB family regulatory protein